MKVFKSFMLVLLFLVAACSGLYVGNSVVEHKLLYNKIVDFVEAAKPYEEKKFTTEKEKREFFEEITDVNFKLDVEKEVVRLIYETSEATINAYYGKDYYLMVEETNFTKTLHYLNEGKIHVFAYNSETKEYEFKEFLENKFMNFNYDSSFKDYFEYVYEEYNKDGLKGAYTKYFDFTTINNKTENYYDFIGYFGYDETTKSSTYCFEGSMNLQYNVFSLNLHNKLTNEKILTSSLYSAKLENIKLPEEVQKYFLPTE